MIPGVTVALVLLALWQAEPTDLTTVAVETIEQCRGERDAAAPPTRQWRDLTSGRGAVVHMAPHRCDVLVQDWTADDGELIQAIWATLHGAPAWSVIDHRMLVVNERGPARWSRFVQTDADGAEIARVTVIEPSEGGVGPFSLTYEIVE